jgi:hypothetical protein
LGSPAGLPWGSRRPDRELHEAHWMGWLQSVA